MNKKEIEDKFLMMNPSIKANRLLWNADGRLEWMCSHGIGHTVWHPKGSDFFHGCDGCCKRVRVLKLSEGEE